MAGEAEGSGAELAGIWADVGPPKPLSPSMGQTAMGGVPLATGRLGLPVKAPPVPKAEKRCQEDDVKWEKLLQAATASPPVCVALTLGLRVRIAVASA